jgi:hypothetical protein
MSERILKIKKEREKLPYAVGGKKRERKMTYTKHS